MAERFDREQNKRVGLRLRAIREALGMGQLEFLQHVAAACGVVYTQSQLSRWETGIALIGPDQLRVFGPLDPTGGGVEGLLGGIEPDRPRRRRRTAP